MKSDKLNPFYWEYAATKHIPNLLKLPLYGGLGYFLAPAISKRTISPSLNKFQKKLFRVGLELDFDMLAKILGVGMGLLYALTSSNVKNRAERLQKLNVLSKESSDTPANWNRQYVEKLILDDPYLSPTHKLIVHSIIDSEKSDVLSPKTLIKGALKAGASFVPAYLFGQGLGRVLQLSEPVVNTLSTLGGIYNVIRKSNVVGSIIVNRLSDISK